jgi:pyruvate dehydrogenase E1 component beta subunit
MSRIIQYTAAILEATDQCMAADPSVYVMGLGSTDPKGIFGTTLGLDKKYGPNRCMDMPTAENGMTGVAIGSAILGMRPIITHQRVDFALLSLDQIINNAAKWHYMFGGRMKVPVVIRLMIGRGWGQGPQHSQAMHSVFAHIPGLKVVMPTTPHDAKGLLISAVEDDNPVIYMEHRWLHVVRGEVPEEMYRVPIGKCRVVREGSDVTFVCASYSTLEAIRAAEILAEDGIDAEVIDVRTLKPLDRETILQSIAKTGRLVVGDVGWRHVGFASEIMASVAEDAFDSLKAAPIRVTLPDTPIPTSAALSVKLYPGVHDLINAARRTLGVGPVAEGRIPVPATPPDIPDPSFRGPF